ncbi:uncharacterized protein F4822DRAFT_440314 [Hypoxylon trugodes]|uniref:uncharacterized protein n=1 Tax=Hypoxylon trugodes TaxID=326681 RepID=UPI00219D75ED|nr:uncharacterized protein F4822DRAFT_440314 [Hypoxylon trugodes]KAI1384178.1 hypothetical protein F4822DRAFT_440314 [Hypoxylon trugodes]
MTSNSRPITEELTLPRQICARRYCEELSVPDRRMCARHREENRRQQMVRYHRKKWNGLCVRCPEPSIPGKRMCKKHGDTHRIRKLVDSRCNREMGLCGCGNELTPGERRCVNCKRSTAPALATAMIVRAAIKAAKEAMDLNDAMPFSGSSDCNFESPFTLFTPPNSNDDMANMSQQPYMPFQNTTGVVPLPNTSYELNELGSDWLQGMDMLFQDTTGVIPLPVTSYDFNENSDWMQGMDVSFQNTTGVAPVNSYDFNGESGNWIQGIDTAFEDTIGAIPAADTSYEPNEEISNWIQGLDMPSQDGIGVVPPPDYSYESNGVSNDGDWIQGTGASFQDTTGIVTQPATSYQFNEENCDWPQDMETAFLDTLPGPYEFDQDNNWLETIDPSLLFK